MQIREGSDHGGAQQRKCAEERESPPKGEQRERRGERIARATFIATHFLSGARIACTLCREASEERGNYYCSLPFPCSLAGQTVQNGNGKEAIRQRKAREKSGNLGAKELV